MRPIIQVSHLAKDYPVGDTVTQVLKDLSFEIPEGQFVAIIGPSGAGKSTLLYQLSLLDEPTRGSIKIDGHEVSRLSEVATTRFRLQNFGFIFQDYSLVPDLTGLENIIVPALMAGTDRSVAERRAREALAELEVDHVVDRLPNQMSGGEQQRVSIARAVARDPRIIFADEPTASLDTKRSEEVVAVLRALNRKGQTIVMVTHELDYAKQAHRIIELKDGVIESDRLISK